MPSLSIKTDDNSVKLGMETFPLDEALVNVAGYFHVEDTGLTPRADSGIIYRRRGFGSEQIVYQFQPEFRLAGYKESEGASEMSTYNLPFPWTIVVIAYEGGEFKGCRHFFSPEMIYDLDQPLYMPNLPNTNTRGYNRTSVGWVCLYLNGTEDKLETLQQRLDYGLARYDSMGEPYNYGNMDETDGFTSYKERKPEEPWLWDPEYWQLKGEEDGLDWVLDPSNWLPFNVDPDPEAFARKNDDTKGTPYTLRRALFDNHYVYYDIEGAPVLNQWHRADQDERIAIVADKTRLALLGAVEVHNAKVAKPVAPPTVEEVLAAIETLGDKTSMLKLMLLQKCASCKADFETKKWRAATLITSYGNFRFSGRTFTDYHSRTADFVADGWNAKWVCDDCLNDGHLNTHDLPKALRSRAIHHDSMMANPSFQIWNEKKVDAMPHSGTAHLVGWISRGMRDSKISRFAFAVLGMDINFGMRHSIQYDLVSLSDSGRYRDPDTNELQAPEFCVNCSLHWAQKIPTTVWQVFDPIQLGDRWFHNDYDPAKTRSALKRVDTCGCIGCIDHNYDHATGVYVSRTRDDVGFSMPARDIAQAPWEEFVQPYLYDTFGVTLRALRDMNATIRIDPSLLRHYSKAAGVDFHELRNKTMFLNPYTLRTPQQKVDTDGPEPK